MILSPSEMDTTAVVEKNQQCTCKDCGKVFNSVWYLKQHAVKHSNDRPFKCKYCYKVRSLYHHRFDLISLLFQTYKFRSNLYQHKCPDRIKPLNAYVLLFIIDAYFMLAIVKNVDQRFRDICPRAINRS